MRQTRIPPDAGAQALSCSTFVAFCFGVQIAGPLFDDPHYKVLPSQLDVSACIPRVTSRQPVVRTAYLTITSNSEENHQWLYVMYSASTTAFDTFVLIMVLIKARLMWQSPTKFLQALVREQILFFVMCTTATLLNTV